MGMLAFFPWLTIEEPIEVGRFRLVPFERGQAPGGAGTVEQALIDGVLAPFLDRPSRPVNVATIARLGGRAYTADLDEEERNELFVFSQVTAFAGLAAREYCNVGTARYCNASDFSFLIQGFRDEPNGTVFTVRRRDGATTVRVTADAYQVLAPPQRSFTGPIRIDTPLVQGFLGARGAPLWNRLFEAIGPFLRANTDSADVAEQTEVVDMVGAFERVLGVWSAKKLRRELERHFRPSEGISPSAAPRIPPERQDGPSVRHFWMGDLYALRNAHAHGDQAAPATQVWDRAEHLLLAAYAFPLLVKSLLHEEGFYALTDDDREAIDLFEWRARAAGHLLEAEDGHRDVRWNTLLCDFIEERGRRKMVEFFRRQAPDAEGVDGDETQ